MDLMRNLVATIAGDRLPITYAFHCPQTMDGTQAQPHLHLLISGRQDDGIARAPTQHFKRYNPTHPSGAPKDPALYHYRAVKGWRVTISDVINVHLERAGLEERLHPDRLADRDITRQPEPKLLPPRVGNTGRRVSSARRCRRCSPSVPSASRPGRLSRRTRGSIGRSASWCWASRMPWTCPRSSPPYAPRERWCGTRRPCPARDGGYAGVEQDDRALGDLAGGSTQAQAEAQALWRGVQDLSDAWQLVPLGRMRVEQLRTAAQGIWRDTTDAERLRDVGREAADDAWRDAVLLWAEEQGARALRDVGWDAMQDA